MSIGDLQLKRLAFFDLELDPFIEVGIRTLPEHEDEEPEGSGGLEIDIVLLSDRGTKINAFRGVHGRPLFKGAVALGQEAQGHVEIKLAELPPVCVGLWVLAVGGQEWCSKDFDGVGVEMMVAVNDEPAASGQIFVTAADISGSGASIALILRHGNCWTLGSYPLEVTASPTSPHSPHGRGAGDGWLERCTAARNDTGVTLELGKTHTRERKLPPPKPLPEAASPWSERRQTSSEVQQLADERVASARQERDSALEELANAKDAAALAQEERDLALDHVGRLEVQLKASRAESARLTEELEELHRVHEEELRKLQETLAEQQEDASSVRANSDRLQDLHDVLEASNKEQEEALKTLQAKLSDKEHELEGMRAKLDLKAPVQEAPRKSILHHAEAAWKAADGAAEAAVHGVAHGAMASFKATGHAMHAAVHLGMHGSYQHEKELHDVPLERQVEDLHKQLAGKEEKIEDLKGQLNGCEQKLQMLRDQLLARDDKMMQLERSHDRHSTLAKEAKAEVHGMKIQLQVKDEEREKLLTSHEEALHELDLQVAHLTAQLETKETHYEQLHELHREMVATSEDQERELEGLHEHLALKGDRVRELEPLNSEQEQELDRLHKHLVSTEERLEELEPLHSEREQELQTLHRRVRELEPLRSEQERELEMLQQRVREWELSHSRQEQELGCLHEHIASREERIRDLEPSQKQLLDASGEQTLEIADLRLELRAEAHAQSRQHEHAEELRMQVSRAAAQSRQHEHLVEELRARASARETQEMSKLQTELGAQSEARNRQHEHALEELRAQASAREAQELGEFEAKLRAASEAQSRQQEHAVEAYSRQAQELGKLQARLATAEQMHEASFHAEAGAEQEVEHLKAEMRAKEQEHRQHRQMHTSQEDSMRKLDMQIARFQAQLAAKDEQYQQLNGLHEALVTAGKEQDNELDRLHGLLVEEVKELEGLKLQLVTHEEMNAQVGAQTQTRNRRWEHEIERMQTQLATKDSQLAEMRTFHTQHLGKLEQRQELEHQAVVKEQDREVERLHKQLAAQDEELKELDVLKLHLLSQEETSTQVGSEAQARSRRFEHEMERMQTQMASKESQLTEMRQLHMQLLARKEAEHKKEIEKLRVEAAASSDRHVELQDELQDRLQAHEKQYQQLHDQYVAVSPKGREAHHLHDTFQGMEHLLVQLHSDAEASRSELEEKEKQHRSQLEGKEKQHRSELEGKEQQHSKELGAFIHDKQKELNEIEEEVRVQVSQAKAESRKHEHAVEELRAQASKQMEDQLDDLESKLRVKDEKLRVKDDRLKELESEFEAEKDRIVERHTLLTEENTQHAEKLKSHSEKIEHLHGHLAICEGQLQQARNEQSQRDFNAGEAQQELQMRLDRKHHEYQHLHQEYQVLKSTGHKKQQEQLAAYEEKLSGMTSLQMQSAEQELELQGRLASEKAQYQELQEEYKVQEIRQLAGNFTSGEATALLQPRGLRPAGHRFNAASCGVQGGGALASRWDSDLGSTAGEEEENLAKMSDLEKQKLQSQLKLMKRLQAQVLTREHPMTAQKLEQSVERLQAQIAITLEVHREQVELTRQRRMEEVAQLQQQLATRADECEHERFTHEQTVRRLNLQMSRLQEELADQEQEWQHQRDQLQLVASRKQQKEVERLHTELAVREDEFEHLQKQFTANGEDRKQVQELKGRLQKAENAHQKLRATHDEDLQKASLEEARLYHHHLQLQDHHQQLQDLHAALGATAKQQQLEIESLQSQLAAQEEQMKDAKSLEAQLASERDHCQELERLRAHVASQAEARIRRREQEVAHLRMQLGTREEQLKEMDVLQKKLTDVAGPEQHALLIAAEAERQRRQAQQGPLRAEHAAMLASRRQHEEELRELQARLLLSESEQRQQEEELQCLRTAHSKEAGSTAFHMDQAARLRLLGQNSLQQLEQAIVTEREGRRKSREAALSELQEMQAGLAAKENTTKVQAIQIAQKAHIAETWSHTAEMQTRHIAELQRELAAQGQAAQTQTAHTMHIANLEAELLAQEQAAQAQTMQIAHLQSMLTMHSQTSEAQTMQLAEAHRAFVHEEEGRRRSREAAQLHVGLLQSELAAHGAASEAQAAQVAWAQDVWARAAAASRSIDEDSVNSYSLQPALPEVTQDLPAAALPSNPMHHAALPAQWHDSLLGLQSEAERKVEKLDATSKSEEADPSRDLQGLAFLSGVHSLGTADSPWSGNAELGVPEISMFGEARGRGTPGSEAEHPVGSIVQIKGLPMRPSLNEHLAEVLLFDATRQQYQLRLRTDSSLHQLGAAHLCKASAAAPPVTDTFLQGALTLNGTEPSLSSTLTKKTLSPGDPAHGSSVQARHHKAAGQAGSISGALGFDLLRRDSHASSGSLKLHGSAESEQGSDNRSGQISYAQRMEPQPGQLGRPRPSMDSLRPSIGSLVSSTGWGRMCADAQSWPDGRTCALPLPSSAGSLSDAASPKRDAELQSDSDEDSQVALQDTRPDLHQLNPLVSEPSFGEVAADSAPNRLTDSLPAFATKSGDSAGARQMALTYDSIFRTSPPAIRDSEGSSHWPLPKDPGGVQGGDGGFLGQLDSGASAFGASCAGNLAPGGISSGALGWRPPSYMPPTTIGDDGAKHLAAGLAGSQIQTLDLVGNRIGDDGAKHLAAGLAGSQIQTPGLSLNRHAHGTSPGVRAPPGGTAAESHRRESLQLPLPTPAFGLTPAPGMAELPADADGATSWPGALPQLHSAPASPPPTRSALAAHISELAAASQYQKGVHVGRADFAAAWMGSQSATAGNIGAGDAAAGILYPGNDVSGTMREALPFGTGWSAAPAAAGGGMRVGAAPRMLLRPPRCAEPP